MANSNTSAPKKNKRRMKKQVRKTLGGLFLASAIVVAAIPTPDARAGVSTVDYPDLKVEVVNYTDASMTNYSQIDGKDAPDTWQSTVPYVADTEQIFTTGSSSTETTFQFAFIEPAGSADKVAVILGANITNLPGGKLTIPQKVDGFLKYASTSSNDGYCAVNRDGQYMFYQVEEQVPHKEDEQIIHRIINPDMGIIKNLSDPNSVKENYSDGYTDAGGNSCSQIMSLQEDGTYQFVCKYYIKIEVTDPDTGIVTEVWEPKEARFGTEIVYDTVEAFYPCFEDTYISNWKSIEDRDSGELFYYDDAAGSPVDITQTDKFKQVSNDTSKGRIHNVTVRYIGRQYLEGANGIWKVKGEVTEANPNKGVFSGKGQIKTLVIASDSIIGVGDYAFYGCTGLNAVSLENGLNTIGNGAFQDCINMLDFTMDINSNISIIGKDAFKNCTGLTNLTIPVNVRAIGSSCFENCQSLSNIDLCGGAGGDLNVILETIGMNAFVGCQSLVELRFPKNFKQYDIDRTAINGYYVDYLDGCTSLQRMIFDSTTFDLLENTHMSPYDVNNPTCNIGIFIKKLSDSFYFEAADEALIHETAKQHSASFKYAGEDKFEKVIYCDETPQHANTFMVNSNNELIDMRLDDDCHIIEIPEKIGTYGVSTIGEYSFQYKCNLYKVTIPSTVTSIQQNAFKGCHNLQDVIFNEPINIASIGDGAFDTQEIVGSGLNCNKCFGTLATTPYLSFTGTVAYGSAPFEYAMNGANKINNQSQQDNTYITFYSPWPTNLTVMYDYTTGQNTLINYPKKADLTHYAVKKYDGTQSPTDVVYPAITNELVSQASSAAGTPEEDRTAAQNAIMNSAYNIVLPAGIEAIKDGIFSGFDRNGDTTGDDTNTDIKSIMVDSVSNIQPFTFKNCTGLNRFYQNNSVASSGYSIGDYAFKDCTQLNYAEVGAAVDTMGLRPFAGCGNIPDVNCGESPYFTCADQIIYELSGGQKNQVVECLECRGKTAGSAQVGPDELAGVTGLYPEAFKDCDGIGNVDLLDSSISKISEQAFALTSGLYSVKLPESCKSIAKGAFWTSNLSYIEVPDGVSLIQPETFANVQLDPSADSGIYIDPVTKDVVIENRTSGHKTITAYCVKGSPMDVYADDYYYINPSYYKPTIYHTVYFWDTYYSTTDPTLITTQKVLDGDAANPPDLPTHDGITATGWTPNYTNIVRDTDVTTVWGDDIHAVWFQYTDPNTGKTVKLTDIQYVEDGKSATPPETDPYCAGYIFSGWSPDYRNIHDDGAIIAVFKSADPGNRHNVSFYSYDGTLWASFLVDDGASLVPPAGPTRPGHKFISWMPNDFSSITSDMTCVPYYDREPTPTPKPTPKPTSPVGPTPTPVPSGQPTSTPTPTPTGKPVGPTATPTPTPNPGVPSATPKTYSVSVSGGSGSGTYAAGTIVPLFAYDLGTGQVFDKWTTSSAAVGFANASSPSTFFVMPASNVAITATFKVPGSNNGGGNGGNNGGNGGNGGGNSGNYTNPSGTKVEVNKSGISNTGIAGATVSGSTDNFIVKVTDDQNAADMALRALQNKFGDITQIKYLPMDISLYDSTGRTKIADTSGMSVNLTLPLPDDLAPYAGNNKVASVQGGIIEDLNSRFTTVDGVPCISFTATHFSPYVIYVDTANLTQATIDYTPKTGDPIHPKWFLAIGLACISFVLFFKKDKRVKVKAA